MGGAVTTCLAAERKSWVENTLEYDEEVRTANLPLVEKFVDGQDLYLAHTETSYGGMKFRHFFITNNLYFFEFGSPSLSIYESRVTISVGSQLKYPMDEIICCVPVSGEIRNRMRMVIGMCNYSLCLRNSEHIAAYVIKAMWFSDQMVKGGMLKKFFKSSVLGDDIRKVNSFPSSIIPHKANADEKIYASMDQIFTPNRWGFYLDNEEDTYNILMVGPTGSGKSHLVNVMLNSPVCKSAAGPDSVTRDFYFVQCSKSLNDREGRETTQKVVIADTVGLCDTEWEDQKIMRLVQSRVSSSFKYIDAVYVVIDANRLLQNFVTNIEAILHWLHYSHGANRKRFVFILTHASSIIGKTEDQMWSRAVNLLHIKADTPFIYTDFPPEEDLSESALDRVKACHAKLKRVQPEYGHRLKVDPTMCSIL